ncbi:MAG: methionyl-tRNA formyltransferase [Bacilli bacterium]|nr:methionyl-tRNA formyltransferase [Bacilli bacterium]
MKEKKVVFMGTPEFSVPVLKELIEKTNVKLVVTQPDKKIGRHQTLEPTPIKKVALESNIEVYQPTKIKEEYEAILKHEPDIIITCAYGQIIPKELLEYPKYGAINVHASLLPKLRGGAPLHKCIIDGYEETGITIMYMAEGMDSGDIIAQEKIKIEDLDNVGTIHDKLSSLGASLLTKTLPSIFEGTNDRIAQNEEEVTYAYNITREEEKIDFNRPAKDVYNQIRGLYPYPIAYTLLDDEIIKITESKISEKNTGQIGEITEITKEGITVKCAEKSITITKIKPSGKKEMSVSDFINGRKKEELIGRSFK